MTAFAVSTPSGISPKVRPELLQPNMAQKAENVILLTGGCAPLRAPVQVATLLQTGLDYKTIYKFGNRVEDGVYWFAWPGKMNVARGPVAGDAEMVTVFSGDGMPRKTSYSMATAAGGGYPAQSYLLKVPSPADAPAIDMLSYEAIFGETTEPIASTNIIGALSKGFVCVSAAEPNYTDASCQMNVISGAEIDTMNWNITATPSAGVVGTMINGGQTFKVTSMNVNEGSVLFRAERDGYVPIEETFYIAKSTHQDAGRRITLSGPTFLYRSDSGEYLQRAVVKSGFGTKQVLQAEPNLVVKAQQFYLGKYRPATGRFVVETSPDGIDFIEHYVPDKSADSVTFELPSDISAVRVTYYPRAGGANFPRDNPLCSRTFNVSYNPPEIAVGDSSEIKEERAYIYTNLTKIGNYVEESYPSPAALTTTTSTMFPRLSGFSVLPSGDYNFIGRRIYRTVTSESGTSYYFVAEIGKDDIQFVDTVDVASIGEPIQTLDWDAPPDDLKCVTSLPSGALCGISGKEICFSVIGAPYAWPQKYRLTVDYDPVAVAPLGHGVIVLTNGYPYLINSGDPESARMIKLDSEQACVSARSVVAMDGAVAYASPDGLVLISQSGATVPTMGLFSRSNWQAMHPETIFADLHDMRYYGFFDGGGGFIFDPSGGVFTTHNINATACYSDPVNDKLYIASGNHVYSWDAGSLVAASWRSKLFVSARPITMAAARVRAESYNDLTFKFYVDGVLKHTQKVTSSSTFRLPAGYSSTRFEFEVVGTDAWYFAGIAQSVEELKNV